MNNGTFAFAPFIYIAILVFVFWYFATTSELRIIFPVFHCASLATPVFLVLPIYSPKFLDDEEEDKVGFGCCTQSRFC